MEEEIDKKKSLIKNSIIKNSQKEKAYEMMDKISYKELEDIINEIENESCTDFDKKNLIKKSNLNKNQKETALRMIGQVSYSELKQIILEIEDETKKEIQKANIERLQEKERIINYKINTLKEKGYSDYCEYKIIKLSDSYGGSLDISYLTELLNNYALEGWKVKTSYSNELGKNSTSSGINGFSTSTNSTIDEHIIILERTVKIKEN